MKTNIFEGMKTLERVYYAANDGEEIHEIDGEIAITSCGITCVKCGKSEILLSSSLYSIPAGTKITKIKAVKFIAEDNPNLVIYRITEINF